jgi:antitoxin MazE
MKGRIVQIGNSRGIRLPKVLLEEAQLEDEVELEAEPGRIVIRRGNRPRTGWAAAARRMHQRGKDQLVDPTTATRVRRGRMEVAVESAVCRAGRGLINHMR